jgi:phospholipid/cholesterol/gamma-HCH transport system substrate-binding protein
MSYLVKHQADKRVAVGGLITAAMFMAMVAIIIISGDEGLFRKSYILRAKMVQVNGLQSGAPVWLAGVNIGSVSEIVFLPKDTVKISQHGDLADTVKITRIEVKMKIKQSVQKLIRSNSTARIGTLGLLGDKYVAVTLGDPDSNMLVNMDYIRCTNPVDFEEILAKGVGTIGTVDTTLQTIKRIVTSIDNAEGTIGLLIKDPYMYFNMGTVFEMIRNISKKIDRNEGTIGLLFNDTTLYWQTQQTLSELASLADTLKRGDGTLKMLLRDPALYNSMMGTVGKIDSMVANIQAGKGTTGALISDKDLYLRLASTVTQLDSLIKMIKDNPDKYLKVKISLF